MKIKKIQALSIAKVAAVLYSCFGLIMGPIIILLSHTQNGPPNPMGWYSIIIYPIQYGIIGFSSGFLTATFFNLATKFVGAIEIETE